MNLRKYARGKPCMARIPGVCRHRQDTTVLAHKNGGGMGMKQPDFIACWADDACHHWLDVGHTSATLDGPQYTRRDRDALHDEAIIRTQQELLKTANKHGVTLEQAIDEWARGLEL